MLILCDKILVKGELFFMLYNIKKDEIPHKVFRYVPWNDFTMDVIKNKHIFLSPIKNLNDKFEFRTHIMPLNNELKCNNIIEKIQFDVNGIDVTSQVIENSKEVDKSLKEIIYFELDNTRISCFTVDNNNTMMWNFYGNEYKGICLEWTDVFSNIESSNDILGKVKYGKYSDAVEAMRKQRDIILNTSNCLKKYNLYFPIEINITAPDIWAKYFFKSCSWMGDHEFRLIRYSTSNYSIKEYFDYNQCHLTGVYCGIDMQINTKKEVYDLVKKFSNNTTVYEAQYKREGWGGDFLPFIPPK